MIGSVYFIQEEGGSVKIGWTAGDVHRRRDNLQTGNSRALLLLGFIEGVPQSVEAEWQLRFRDLHSRAEWFVPGRALLNAISQHATPSTRAPKRYHTPRGLNASSRPSVGATLLVKWMADHGLSVEEVAELTGYRPAYLGDLLAGRAPFGRESAKRFHALAGEDLLPSALLADMMDRKHIRLYVARAEAA